MTTDHDSDGSRVRSGREDSDSRKGRCGYTARDGCRTRIKAGLYRTYGSVRLSQTGVNRDITEGSEIPRADVMARDSRRT